MRKKILIGNWKLNHYKKDATDFFARLNERRELFIGKDVAIAPVAPLLDYVGSLGADLLSLAAQNVYFNQSGAFTGEWSARHLKELGVSYCLVGHSERRVLFGETDDDVSKKVSSCLKEKIIPVICVGESLNNRQQSETQKIITRQIESAVSFIKDESFIVAYEPVWAIGTGHAASSDDAEVVHRLIRIILADKLGNIVADKVRIIYGGSVTPDNIKEFLSKPDIDGCLIGKASLQAESFLAMVEELQS